MTRPVLLSWVSQRFANPGRYASRSDRHGPAGHHTGVDYAAFSGTPVRATHAGLVIESSYDSVLGNHIFIRSQTPDGPIVHGYWHLSVRLVHEGQHVHRKRRIGRVGSTGNSTGPHLHYQENRGSYYDYNGHIRPRFVGRRHRRRRRR